MKNKLIYFLISFLCFSVQGWCGEYLRIHFTSSATIATRTSNGMFVDPTGNRHKLFNLTFKDRNLINVFKKFKVIEFEQEFPACNGLKDSTFIRLSRIYRVRVYSGLSTLLNGLKILNTQDIDLKKIAIAGDPVILTEVNPNDFNVASQIPGNFEGASYQDLEIMNVKKGWEITRGLKQITIGIADLGYYAHPDLGGNSDEKVLNFSTCGLINTTGGGLYHGIAVAGAAAAINDNNESISSVGNKVTLRYYSMDLNSILQAAKEGCKVVNMSWYSPNDHYTQDNQDFIDKVYDEFKIVIIASAGNCNDGAPCTTPYYPASYNHVISVSTIGSMFKYNEMSPVTISQVLYPANSSTPIPPLSNLNTNFSYECLLGNTDALYTTPNSSGAGFYLNWNNHQRNQFVDICAPGYYALSLKDPSIAKTGFEIGSSISAPYVAGAAALLLSLNPNMSPDDVEDILKRSAIDIYNKPNTNNAQYLGLLGAGSLDVGAALSLAITENRACMSNISDIVWSFNNQVIDNNDYASVIVNNYDVPLVFSVPSNQITEGATLEWEFISGNDVVRKTGNDVSLYWNNGDFSINVGTSNWQRKNTFPLEVYVRQRGGDILNYDYAESIPCYSGFYKEIGYSTEVPDASIAINAPYASQKCTGNYFIDWSNLLTGNYRARNIYVGSKLSTTNGNVQVNTQQFGSANLVASDEIRLLSGFYAGSNSNNEFRAYLESGCALPPSVPSSLKPDTAISNNLLKKENVDSTFLEVEKENPITQNNDLLISPNPAKNTLYVLMPKGDGGSFHLQLASWSGVIYKDIKQTFPQSGEANQLMLDISSIPKGLFLIKYESNSKAIIKKAIKE